MTRMKEGIDVCGVAEVKWFVDGYFGMKSVRKTSEVNIGNFRWFFDDGTSLNFMVNAQNFCEIQKTLKFWNWPLKLWI